MRFTTIAKADVLDDANPNTTPPAAARCIALSELLGSKQNAELTGIAVAHRVLTAVPALCADGVSDVVVWIYDEASATWVQMPTTASGLASTISTSIPLPATGMATKVFVQLKNVGGTSKDHVQILVAPITSAEALAGGAPATAANQAAILAALGLPTTPNPITPSDSTDTSALTAKGLYVSVGGTLAIRGTGAPSTTVSFNVVAGQYVAFVCSRVMAATTATVVGCGA